MITPDHLVKRESVSVPDDEEDLFTIAGVAQPQEAEFENRITSESQPVTLSLGEPSRLDKLMPEITRLVDEEGWSWKRISQHFKVNAGWASEYYRRRK